MRFCKQRDRYSCGAIALLNIDKFFGRHVTYRNLPQYKKLTKCSKADGIFLYEMTEILGRASRRKWKQAQRFLQEGNCILLSVRRKDNSGHFYLMIIYDHDIQIVNYSKSHTLFSISSRLASQLLKQAERTWYINERIL